MKCIAFWQRISNASFIVPRHFCGSAVPQNPRPLDDDFTAHNPAAIIAEVGGGSFLSGFSRGAGTAWLLQGKVALNGRAE
jgi:hypothetical protein